MIKKWLEKRAARKAERETMLEFERAELHKMSEFIRTKLKENSEEVRKILTNAGFTVFETACIDRKNECVEVYATHANKLYLVKVNVAGGFRMELVK